MNHYYSQPPPLCAGQTYMPLHQAAVRLLKSLSDIGSASHLLILQAYHKFFHQQRNIESATPSHHPFTPTYLQTANKTVLAKRITPKSARSHLKNMPPRKKQRQSKAQSALRPRVASARVSKSTKPTVTTSAKACKSAPLPITPRTRSNGPPFRARSPWLRRDRAAREEYYRRGNYSAYNYRPEYPLEQAGITHSNEMRYWICCECNAVPSRSSQEDWDTHRICSPTPTHWAGKWIYKSNEGCSHERCSNCAMETQEPAGWLHPECEDHKGMTIEDIMADWPEGHKPITGVFRVAEVIDLTGDDDGDDAGANDLYPPSILTWVESQRRDTLPFAYSLEARPPYSPLTDYYAGNEPDDSLLPYNRRDLPLYRFNSPTRYFQEVSSPPYKPPYSPTGMLDSPST